MCITGSICDAGHSGAQCRFRCWRARWNRIRIGNAVNDVAIGIVGIPDHAASAVDRVVKAAVRVIHPALSFIVCRICIDTTGDIGQRRSVG